MNKHKGRSIAGSASIFLDCLRLFSALIVLYIHSQDQWYPAKIHAAKTSGNWSHAAVVVFFVLSGYVIAHTTASNNRGPLQYAQARLSRLYSVVLPALVITAVAEIITHKIAPDLREAYSRGAAFPRYIISAGFLNEIWFYSAAPIFNIPLWSLSFEFWYYTIFGIWFYSKKGRSSFILLLASCLIAGPKILLLMPIWLAGCIAYNLPQPSLSISKRWICVFLSITIAVLTVGFVPIIPIGIGIPPLSYAGGFLSDWGTGLFISIALWFLPTSTSNLLPPFTVKAIRKAADLTFPIYVLHYPFLILFRAVFPFRINDKIQQWQALISVLMICAVIGFFLERKRRWWVKMFNTILMGLFSTSRYFNESVSSRGKKL
jgi:peptidoglycan/LPS O-acetylase OafA/YrhL